MFSYQPGGGDRGMCQLRRQLRPLPHRAGALADYKTDKKSCLLDSSNY